MFCAPSHSRMSFLMHKQVSLWWMLDWRQVLGGWLLSAVWWPSHTPPSLGNLYHRSACQPGALTHPQPPCPFPREHCQMWCDMEEREREDKKERERENQVNEGMTLFDGALGRQIDYIYKLKFQVHAFVRTRYLHFLESMCSEWLGTCLLPWA